MNISFCLLLVWGFFAHEKINYHAVYNLPLPMFKFFKTHRDYLALHATDPDKRRYAVPEEAIRHYIDLNHYFKDSVDVKNMPKYWHQACEKFTEDTLKKHGIGPWNLERQISLLTSAFAGKNKKLILKYSADIGHYVGDLCVPLHTTSNYNGQHTNQDGIHGLWESRVPELSFNNYKLAVQPAQYIENINQAVWNLIWCSYYQVDSVLKAETLCTRVIGEDNKYTFEERGAVIQKTYSKRFSLQYEQMLNNMQERKLKMAIYYTSNFWYTAWVNGGQPNLEDLL